MNEEEEEAPLEPWTSSPISPPFNTTTLVKINEQKGKGGPFGGPACLLEPSCPGEARSRFEENKYGLKNPRDFTMSEGHGYSLVRK
jgi:hypothetical protein